MTRLAFEDWATVAAVGLLGGVGAAFLSFQMGAGPYALLWAAAGAALAGVFAHETRKSALRRRDAFAELARAQGWAHQHDPPRDAIADLSRCLPFRRGREARAQQILSGRRDGVAFRLADATYVTGSGKHRQTHRVAALALQMPFDFALTIEAESLGHKLADALGGEDIDVESDEFSRRFWVKSPDRRMAYDVLHARAVEALLAAGDGWTWHWDATTLVLSRKGSLEPANCLPILEQGLAFRRLLPRHLLAANAWGAA